MYLINKSRDLSPDQLVFIKRVVFTCMKEAQLQSIIHHKVVGDLKKTGAASLSLKKLGNNFAAGGNYNRCLGRLQKNFS